MEDVEATCSIFEWRIIAPLDTSSLAPCALIIAGFKKLRGQLGYHRRAAPGLR